MKLRKVVEFYRRLHYMVIWGQVDAHLHNTNVCKISLFLWNSNIFSLFGRVTIRFDMLPFFKFPFPILSAMDIRLLLFIEKLKDEEEEGERKGLLPTYVTSGTQKVKSKLFLSLSYPHQICCFLRTTHIRLT